MHQLRGPLVLSSQALSPDICGWSGRAGRLPEVIQGGKGWGTGSATRTRDPRTLGTRKEAIKPCLWEAAGGIWWPHLASVPRLRRAELFTQDLASSFMAEEGRRCDTGPLCTPGLARLLGFSVPGIWSLGREQPVAELLWDGGPSWLPLGPHLAIPVHQGTPHLGPPGPIQAHPEEVLLRDPGLGGGRAWGQGDGVMRGSQTHLRFSLHPPGSVLSPGAPPPPHPHPATQTERLVPLNCPGALGLAWGGVAGKARLCG